MSRIFFDPLLLVLLFLPQPEVLGLHVFDGAAPAAESKLSYCCSASPDPHVSLVSQFSYRVDQPDGLIRTAYNAEVL